MNQKSPAAFDQKGSILDISAKMSALSAHFIRLSDYGFFVVFFLDKGACFWYVFGMILFL